MRRRGEHMLAVVGVEVAADVEFVRAPVVRGLPQQEPGQRPAAARRERHKHTLGQEGGRDGAVHCAAGLQAGESVPPQGAAQPQRGYDLVSVDGDEMRGAEAAS